MIKITVVLNSNDYVLTGRVASKLECFLADGIQITQKDYPEGFKETLYIPYVSIKSIDFE